MKLSELHEPLTREIQLMLERPQAMHPWVVVQLGERFVQFCGSDTEPLIFESPEHDSQVVLRRDMSFAAERAAEFALMFIRDWQMADEDTDIIIETHPSRNDTN